MINVNVLLPQSNIILCNRTQSYAIEDNRTQSYAIEHNRTQSYATEHNLIIEINQKNLVKFDCDSIEFDNQIAIIRLY